MFSLSKYVVENDMSFFMKVNGPQEKQLFFSIYTIYTFSNKKFTVTRYLYI